MQTAPSTLTQSEATRVLRKTWQPVALSADVREGDIRVYTLLGEKIAVARLHDRVLAVADGCPHKGSSFEIARIEGEQLVCGYHGWRFNSEGACVAIPSLEQLPAQIAERAQLRRYGVLERYGFVWVLLDSDDALPLAELEDVEQPGWSYLAGPPMSFDCGFRREIENFLDMTHFAFAHRESLGSAASALAPAVTITETPSGFTAETVFPATNGAVRSRLQSRHKRTYVHYLPNITSITMTFEDGDRRVLLHVPSMNGPESCTVFWALAQSPGFDGPPLEDQLTFACAVLDEDRRICESQSPRETPLSPAPGEAGVLVTPADAMANAYQRQFRRFLLEVGAHT